jgi:hypothetical protein
MVPRVFNRGYSHKGLFNYLLHDKGSATENDRVGWTYSYNIPSDDPEKAMKWLAYNSMNADQFKAEYAAREGIELSTVGRKASGKNVYSYSLAWHPDETPEKQIMIDAAVETIQRLGLKDHPCFIVNHIDEPQQHIHVVSSLVNPTTGKTASMSNDALILSKWADEYEREHGIFCEQRIENNKERQNTEIENQKKFVKHRSKGLSPEDKEYIQTIYQQSESGKDFQTAMSEAGYTLANGNKRKLAIVDEQGKIHNLSRQLSSLRPEGMKSRAWGEEISNKLSDLDNLRFANIIAGEKAKEWEKQQEYDKEQTEINRQNKELDAADEAAKNKVECDNIVQFNAEWKSVEEGNKPQNLKKEFIPKNIANDNDKKELKSELAKVKEEGLQRYAIANQLERERSFKLIEWEREQGSLRANKRAILNDFHGTERLKSDLQALEKNIADKNRKQGLGRFFNSTKKEEAQRETLLKQIQNVQNRIDEEIGAMDLDIEKRKLDYIAELEERTVDDVLQDLNEQDKINKAIYTPSHDKTNDIEKSPYFGLS